MKSSSGLREVFQIFQNKESFFGEIEKAKSNRLILYQLMIICIFAFLYGVVMGSYHSFTQSMVAGVKVIILFLSTIILCFPSFFIIQQVLGSKMSLRQMTMIVLSGVVLTALIAAAGRGRAVLGLRGADDVARVPERAALRFGAVLVWADSEALAPVEPDGPAEPVVSAHANGIDNTADPTPNATANAPTRPTTTKPDINDSYISAGITASTRY